MFLIDLITLTIFKSIVSLTFEEILLFSLTDFHFSDYPWLWRWVRTLLKHNCKTSICYFPHFGWFIMCLTILGLWLKFLSHKRHSNGFSPVWILEWAFRLPFRLKVFPQILQKNDGLHSRSRDGAVGVFKQLTSWLAETEFKVLTWKPVKKRKTEE